MFPSRRRLILGRRRQYMLRNNRRMISVWCRSCLAYQQYMQYAADDDDPPSANMSPAKVKPPTRGAQQIIRENTLTVQSYKFMVLGAIGVHGLASIVYGLITDVSELLTISWLKILSEFVMPLSILLVFFIMYKISKPTYSDTNEKTLVFPGYDLNMKSSSIELLKDILLAFVMTHLLTIIHNIFLLCLVLLPIRGLYLLFFYAAEPLFAMHPQGAKQGAKLFLQIFLVMFFAVPIYTLYFYLKPFF